MLRPETQDAIAGGACDLSVLNRGRAAAQAVRPAATTWGQGRASTRPSPRACRAMPSAYRFGLGAAGPVRDLGLLAAVFVGTP
jgi:hypothetical protein